MIDAAGGTYPLAVCFRGTRFRDVPVSDLGQTISSSYVRIYQKKSITSIEAGNSTQSQGIKVKYAAPEETVVYSVDIAWGNMEFTYTEAATGAWDPETHSYFQSTEAGWSCAGENNKITVSNSSNAAVTASFAYTQATGYDTITGAFSSDAAGAAVITGFDIPTAAAYNDGTNDIVAGVRTKSAYFNITGGAIASGTSIPIGTLTVRIDSIG